MKGGWWGWALPFPWALPCRQLLCLCSRPQTHRTAFASIWTEQWEMISSYCLGSSSFSGSIVDLSIWRFQMALFMEGLQVASSLMRLLLLKLPTPLPHPQEMVIILSAPTQALLCLGSLPLPTKWHNPGDESLFLYLWGVSKQHPACIAFQAPSSLIPTAPRILCRASPLT